MWMIVGLAAYVFLLLSTLGSIIALAWAFILNILGLIAIALIGVVGYAICSGDDEEDDKPP